jgi:hypothetical protein
MLCVDLQIHSFNCHYCEARPTGALADILPFSYKNLAHLSLLDLSGLKWESSLQMHTSYAVQGKVGGV